MPSLTTGDNAGWTNDSQFLVSDPDGSWAQAAVSLNYLVYTTILSGIPQKYATVTGVDMLANGETTLYAVPNGPALTGLKFYVTNILIRVNSVTAFAVAPTIKIGKSASYDHYLPATITTGLDTVGKYKMTDEYLYGATNSTRFDLSDTIKVSVTAGTGTALTYDFIVFGIYL